MIDGPFWRVVCGTKRVHALVSICSTMGSQIEGAYTYLSRS